MQAPPLPVGERVGVRGSDAQASRPASEVEPLTQPSPKGRGLFAYSAPRSRACG